MSPSNGHLLEGWSPPWSCSHQSQGLFAMALTSTGLATLTEFPTWLDRQEGRTWVSRWLSAWLARSSREEAATACCFAYVVLSATSLALVPSGVVSGEVAEFGYGSQPRCPENWGLLPLSELVGMALRDLDGPRPRQ
jgi:hypothetical protein